MSSLWLVVERTLDEQLQQLHETNCKAARETGALEEAKDNVEKQVEALTWHLQLIALGMFKVLRVKCYY
ncbi:hypothetical protein C5167_034951 [Papaver somniferum]|uniref:Uncharacterized protein n=1 Tax=Papaver somniferum TaxID=3469 RepID=A0A4Y7KI95_PAPSO|nr:hypothetical protein C5167_034951 [Papaver somniferum]